MNFLHGSFPPESGQVIKCPSIVISDKRLLSSPSVVVHSVLRARSIVVEEKAGVSIKGGGVHR